MAGLNLNMAGRPYPSLQPVEACKQLLARIIAGEAPAVELADELLDSADCDPSAAFSAFLDELAEHYPPAHLAGLFGSCDEWMSSGPEVACHQIISLFEAEALAFAPLIGGFLLAISKRLEAGDFDHTLFLARDGIPLFVVAQVFAARGVRLPAPKLIEINRSMCPDHPATLSSDAMRARQLRGYLQGFAGKRVVLIDTGVYGTLVSCLDELAIFRQSEACFLYSRNPRHFGFLNSSLYAIGTDRDHEIICDSIECWPKPYETCVLTGDESSSVPLTRPTGRVSLLAAITLYEALARWAENVALEQIDPARTVAALSTTPTSLMLRNPLPRWEHAEDWLASQRDSSND